MQKTEKSAPRSPLTARIFVILAVVGVSFSAIFVRLADAPSSTLAMLRMAFSALLFLLPMLRARKREAGALRGRVLWMCIAGGVLLGFHFLTYFEAIKNTSLASALVLVNTEILFVAVACVVLLRERIGPWGLAGIAMALIGSVVVTGGDFAFGRESLYGNGMAVLSALCLCVYTLISRTVRKTVSGAACSFVVYACAAVILGAVMCIGGASLATVTQTDVLCALGMAVCCTALGHSVFIWALKYVPAPYVSAARLLEPVFSCLLGYFIFAEVPTLWQLAGGAVVLAGVAAYTLTARSDA